jgi:hypothetical protein
MWEPFHGRLPHNSSPLGGVGISEGVLVGVAVSASFGIVCPVKSFHKSVGGRRQSLLLVEFNVILIANKELKKTYRLRRAILQKVGTFIMNFH